MPASSNSSILNTISSLQNSFTKTEKRIAEIILKSPHLLNQSSLAEISEWLDVGEATFIRFCRTLGFKGFSDFKVKLAIELATQEKKDFSLLEYDINKNDTLQDMTAKLQHSLHQAILETISLLDFNTVESVVELLKNSKRLFLFGMGSSGITAEDAKNKFMRIGFQVDAASNNHIMYMQAALMREGDVVIGISHSGTSSETSYALNVARKAGAKTIALTHYMRSPITKAADYVLVNGNVQGLLQGDSLGTKITQLFVLDLLYAAVVKDEESWASRNKQKTLNVILEKQIK